jgi:hypothetical protein
MHERFLHHCHACRGGVPKCVERVLLECHRPSQFGTLGHEFKDFVSEFATSLEDVNVLLLVGVPLPFMVLFMVHGTRGFSSYGAKHSLTLLSLQFTYRTPEMCCSAR